MTAIRTEIETPPTPQAARPRRGTGHLLAPLVAGTLSWTPALAETRESLGTEPRRAAELHLTQTRANETQMTTSHPYLGMWVTADGHVRQELLPNGRYDEARGSRKSAYQGRYAIRGTHIDYWDDTGFTADGTFVSPDELHHGGMIFYREK